MYTFFFTKSIRKNLLRIPIFLGVFCILTVAHSAHAATLSLIPSNSNVSVGNIITLNVMVNTEGVAINTSDAVIQCPTDILQVLSVSKSNSIFSLWVLDPQFSNTDGQVSFNGGITNPGFTGTNGNLISITFRAKKAGTASVLISDSSVRANDGLGTDVLTSKKNATLVITTPVVPTTHTTPAAPPPTKPSTPVQKSPVPAVHAAPEVATTTQATSSESTITSTAPTISITSYPNQVNLGDPIQIVGRTSVPNADISISLTNVDAQTEVFKINANGDGVYHFQTSHTNAVGMYVLWANILNKDGSSAAASTKVSISVQNPLLIQIGTYTTSLISVLIPSLILILLLLLLMYLGWYKFFSARARLRKDLEEIQWRVHQALRTLADEATEQLETIEKVSKNRKMTAREEKAAKDLRAAVSDVDLYIQKLMEKIKRSEF